MRYSATYSPEDNKLRLYASARLGPETFARVKAAGFIWAPRQQLFVAPAWSPAREDLCLELAGDIEAEEMTLAERAAARAARFDEYAEKRRRDSNAFSRAADAISERFADGQPILIGHHSQRRAEKDRDRMESATRQAVKAAGLVNYWLYRAEGVEAHANHNSRPDVRARRIKTLLSELRGLQRQINDAHKAADFWRRLSAKAPAGEALSEVIGSLPHYMAGPDADAKALRAGELSAADYIARRIAAEEASAAGPIKARWIAHLLNRLAYERGELGPVARYEGELTAVILQAFAREHGAEKPKAEATPAGWRLSSPVPLPLHIAEGEALELSADEWRDLMQSAGYAVETKKPGRAQIPILNFRAPGGLQRKRLYQRGAVETLPQYEVTKADYEAAGKYDGTGVAVSACGLFRFRVMCPRKIPQAMADGVSPYGFVAVYLTDAKTHPAPDTCTGAERAEAA